MREGSRAQVGSTSNSPGGDRWSGAPLGGKHGGSEHPIGAWEREALPKRELEPQAIAEPAGGTGGFLRTVCFVLATGVCYYIATWIAWALCLPGSKVSLFFPPHGVLVSILLLVPTRRWWAYTLAAASAHFLATQQAGWPVWFALQAEAFDAVQSVAVAAGIRIFIRSPLKALTLRDVIVFVLIAVLLVPLGTAFWGAALMASNGFGTHYWIDWRTLGVSQAVSATVLIPAILLVAYHLNVRRPTVSLRRVLEAALLGATTVAVGILVFDQTPAGPGTSPQLLYLTIPPLIWAALRFGLTGISVSMLIITSQAIWGTMHRHGPFLTQTAAENALALQLFLLVTGTPLMALAVVIEEERRSKEALRESKDQMGLAAEAANAAMWVWDVSADDLWMTEHGRSLFGFKPDARINFAATQDRVHPEDRAARESAIKRALETRGGYEIEYRLLEPDGVVRWIKSRARCVEPNDGAGRKLFGISLDVTARKQAEASAAQEREELQKKRAELEHVARVATVGELTASIAHEINQPLGAILSNADAADLLLERHPPPLDEVRQILADIRKDDVRASEVIRRIRTFLQTHATQLQPIRLDEVVAEVLHLVGAERRRRGVEIETALAPDLPLVRADRIHLQQVLLNLLLNGMDAMADVPGAKRLRVTAGRHGNRDVVVAVADTGHGIPANRMPRLFEPFFTTKPNGMGLGLSISRSLVAAQGGRIWAENCPGEGATFQFLVPVDEPAIRQDSPKNEPASREVPA